LRETTLARAPLPVQRPILRGVRTLAYHLSRLTAKLLLAPIVKIRVMGRLPAARDGAWILAGNHISHFDPPLIGIAARRKIDWMGMSELFQHPVFGGWLRAVDTFPVDRHRLDRAAVRTALERLRAGHCVGMFPEGGIRDGARSVLEGAPMRPGVAGLSQMTGAPVVPCVIMGSDRIYALPRLWRPGRRLPVWIAFGEPLRAAAGARAEERAELEARIDENRAACSGGDAGLHHVRDDEPYATAAPSRRWQPRGTGGVCGGVRDDESRAIFSCPGGRRRGIARAGNRIAHLAVGEPIPERLPGQ
jgi:1-acyl-sn-glycerol-3-phosphate acyltransferase